MSGAYISEIVIETEKKEVAYDLIESLEKKCSADNIEESTKDDKAIIKCSFGDFGKESTTSLDEAIEVKNIVFKWIISNSDKPFVLTQDISCYLDGDYVRVIYDFNERCLTVKDWFSETPISARRKTYNTFSFELKDNELSLLAGDDDLVYPVASNFYDDDDDDYFNDINYQRSCISYRVEDLYTEEVINQLISWLSGADYHSNNKDEQIDKIMEQFDIRKKEEGMNFQDFLTMIDDKLA